MMASQPERVVTDRIMRILRAMDGVWCFKAHGGPFQRAGVPDIIGCIDERFFAIEVKARSGKTTALQELTIQHIIAAGGLAGVATSVEQALDILGVGRPA